MVAGDFRGLGLDRPRHGRRGGRSVGGLFRRASRRRPRRSPLPEAARSSSPGPVRSASLPKPWNARSFQATLDGQVVRDEGATRALVSAAATANGRQRALLRADLLVEPNRLDATSFQLEYLPSGLLCIGRVTRVETFGFDARCRAGDGTRRVVHASWSLGQNNDFTGRVVVHA